MLVTVSAFILAASMPAPLQTGATSQAADAPTRSRRPPVAISRHDSTRALKLARRAQGDFESLRRRFLPLDVIVGGGCEAVVGRYCYRQQMAPSAPPEAPEIVQARRSLLATLDTLGALIPGDRWILGQKVRYLIEAGRPKAADSLGIVCAARASSSETKSWCLALIGYTAQQYGNYSRADAAFTSALAEMPATERCKWEDLRRVLGRGDSGPYRHVDCGPREALTSAFWNLVQPLYLRNVNDLRTEVLARVTRAQIEEGTRTPMSDHWGSDDRDALLRFGVALWFSRGERVPGALGPPPIAGYRRLPSFNFFPDGDVFASPAKLTPDDWELQGDVRRPTYAPLWANSFQTLVDHQVSLFRRGDSAFIVAAFDVNDNAALGPARRAGVFAAVIDSGGVLAPVGRTFEKAGLSVVSTLMAPWRPMIVSLEVLDTADHAAGRMRFAPMLPPAGPRLGLSDLLLYAPRDSAPASVADAVPLALHALRAPSNGQVGVFWETYGVRPDGEALDYALTVEKIDQGLFRRALVKLHVVDPDRGLSLHWREMPMFAGGIASRGMTVDVSRLKPGRYRVQLAVTSGTGLPIIAERSLEIL